MLRIYKTKMTELDLKENLVTDGLQNITFRCEGIIKYGVSTKDNKIKSEGTNCY